MAVVDDGPRVAPEDHNNVVSAIVTVHGGVLLTSDTGPGLRVTLRISAVMA